jgi:polyisoprenoid-binding protein YceI
MSSRHYARPNLFHRRGAENAEITQSRCAVFASRWWGSLCLASLSLLVLLSTAFTDTQKARVYTLDLNQSRVILTLTQEGLLSKRYPTHQVAVNNFNGKITLPRDERQTAVEFEAEAKSFVNVDKAMSEFERRGFHDVLQNKVLESERFPFIKFKAVSVSDLKKTGAARSFTLNGEVHLRGVTKSVSLPVSVTLTNDQLRATGEAKLKQSDFGIEPYSGNMGLVKIGDELKVNFSIVAKLATAR